VEHVQRAGLRPLRPGGDHPGDVDVGVVQLKPNLNFKGVL
jgi:hypothetical protein